MTTLAERYPDVEWIDSARSRKATVFGYVAEVWPVPPAARWTVLKASTGIYAGGGPAASLRDAEHAALVCISNQGS